MSSGDVTEPNVVPRNDPRPASFTRWPDDAAVTGLLGSWYPAGIAEPAQQKGIAMTPIAGFIIAIIAAWLVPSGRRAAAVVVIPWLAVLAEQTWILAAGRGHSPPSTVSQLPGAIGYWLVQ